MAAWNSEYSYEYGCNCDGCKENMERERKEKEQGWQTLEDNGEWATFKSELLENAPEVQEAVTMNVLDRLAAVELTITVAEFAELKKLQEKVRILESTLTMVEDELRDVRENRNRFQNLYNEQCGVTARTETTLRNVEQKLSELERQNGYVRNDTPQLVNVYRALLTGSDRELTSRLTEIIENAEGKIAAIKKVRTDLYPDYVLGLKEAKDLVEDILSSWNYTTTQAQSRYFERIRF